MLCCKTALYRFLTALPNDPAFSPSSFTSNRSSNLVPFAWPPQKPFPSAGLVPIFCDFSSSSSSLIPSAFAFHFSPHLSTWWRGRGVRTGSDLVISSRNAKEQQNGGGGRRRGRKKRTGFIKRKRKGWKMKNKIKKKKKDRCVPNRQTSADVAAVDERKMNIIQ